MMSPLSFKAKVGCLPCSICESKYNVHSLKSTSGATPADIFHVSWPPASTPHTVASRGKVGEA